MIRTILKNRLADLTGQIIKDESELKELEEKRSAVLELVNAEYNIPKELKNVGIWLVAFLVNFGGALIPTPWVILNIIPGIVATISGIFLLMSTVDLNKIVMIINKYGYSIFDLKETWEGEKGLGGIKKNQINKDLDRDIYNPLSTVNSRLEKNRKYRKILWNILQSDDMIGKMEEYNKAYKESYVSKLLEIQEMPLLKNIFLEEWNEYLEYLDTVRPENIHFKSTVSEPIKIEKTKNSKNKTLAKNA